MTDLSIIIPCYAENEEIVTTLYTELTSQGCEVIVVDDGATMNLPTRVNSLSYSPHMGYGYAIKRGIEKASRDIVCTIDGDGEHSTKDVIKIYTMFKMVSDCSMVIGTRWNLNEKPIRWIGRKVINLTASLWAKHFLQDLNSGMRIFKKKLALSYFPILCDTFSFTTSLTMSFVTDGYKIAWFPIDIGKRVYGKSRVKLIKDGLITVWYIFWIGFALNTRKFRAWLSGRK